MVDMGFLEREKEIIKTIRAMNEAELDFIVVGGYAVSALARHRFSVDCDIVISKRKLGKVHALGRIDTGAFLLCSARCNKSRFEVCIRVRNTGQVSLYKNFPIVVLQYPFVPMLATM